MRNTPTGLPDWTSSVSSSASDRRARDDRVERVPRTRGPAGAAVDDQVLGALGHVGVEVVHQHPQGGLLRPPFRGDRGAARGTDLGRRRGRRRRLAHLAERIAGRPSLPPGSRASWHPRAVVVSELQLGALNMPKTGAMVAVPDMNGQAEAAVTLRVARGAPDASAC